MAELDTMMDPPIEELLDKVESKFSLVSVAAERARQINSYYRSLSTADFKGRAVPPQVSTTARKPLSIAFEEIAADKVVAVGGATGLPIPEMPEDPAEATDEGEFDTDGPETA